MNAATVPTRPGKATLIGHTCRRTGSHGMTASS
jgi:hypothetical protein